MEDFRLPIRSDYDKNPAEKWCECCLCGTKRIKFLVHFDSGSVAPTVGETITGATSADTGVVEGHTIYSGTVAGGDAAGVIEGSTPTGYDDNNLEIFQNDEALNGSTSGNDFATANHVGAIHITGRLIPESDTVVYRGKRYCRPHFMFKFRRQWQNDERVDTSEEFD